jgi:hypothetical protein
MPSPCRCTGRVCNGMTTSSLLQRIPNSRCWIAGSTAWTEMETVFPARASVAVVKYTPSRRSSGRASLALSDKSRLPMNNDWRNIHGCTPIIHERPFRKMKEKAVSPIICPKCNSGRPTADLAPAWQCPACDIAYNKYLGLS